MHLQVPLIQSLFISRRRLYRGGCHREMALLTMDSWGANVWKKAAAGDSAQSSPECCGSRNIRSLKCFLKHFLQEARRLTFISPSLSLSASLSLYLSLSLSLSPAFIPRPQIYPLHPHLPSSAPKTSSSGRAAVLLFLQRAQHQKKRRPMGLLRRFSVPPFFSFCFCLNTEPSNLQVVPSGCVWKCPFWRRQKFDWIVHELVYRHHIKDVFWMWAPICRWQRFLLLFHCFCLSTVK